MALNHQERQQGAEGGKMDSGASHLLCPLLCHTGQIHLQGLQFPPLSNGGDNLLPTSKSFRLNVSKSILVKRSEWFLEVVSLYTYLKVITIY